MTSDSQPRPDETDEVEGHKRNAPGVEAEEVDVEGHRVPHVDTEDGDDVEGHHRYGAGLEAESNADVEGHSIRHVDADDDDTEGHFRHLEAEQSDDVEGHKRG